MFRPYKIGFYDNFSPYSDKKNSNPKGILYDLWKKTKEKYNLNAEEIFLNENRFEKDIDDMVVQQKYDALFIPAYVNKERINKVNFTRPFMLNKLAIAYKPKKSLFTSFFSILFSTVLPPIGILLLIGLSLGYLLYLFEPIRGKRRALLSTVASMFGEMGFVSERSSLQYGGMFIVFLIMFASFYFTIFLQAATVDKFSESVDSYEITKDTLKGKKILTTKDSTYVNILKKFGAIPVEKDSIDEVVETYMSSINQTNLKNVRNRMMLITNEKYDGFMFDYETTYRKAKENGLVLTSDNLGHNEIAIPVTKSNTRLLDMINKTIVDLQDNDEMKSICRKYINEERAGYCEI